MIETHVISLSYQALILILIVSAPPIVISMCLGLLVSIFQAATQIQEQTLSFTVKLFTVVGVLMVLGGWIGGKVFAYALVIFSHFAQWTLN